MARSCGRARNDGLIRPFGSSGAKRGLWVRLQRGARRKLLGDLIARGEVHQDEGLITLDALGSHGESSTAILQILGQIEDTLATMPSRRAYLKALQPVTM